MRRLLFVLLILNGLLLPLTCVPVLFLLGAVNPMQLAFITEFTVENRTAATVYVTPIGTVSHEGLRRPLPMAAWPAPCVPASQRGRLPIRTGEKIAYYYDWDDINFSELVVESQDGELRQLVVNPNPTANQYTVPKETDFVIDDLDRLGPVDRSVREAYTLAQQRLPWWPILAATTAPALSFVFLRRRYRRLKPVAAAMPLG